MKMSLGHYAIILEGMTKVDADKPDSLALYRDAGMSDKRHRWDMFRAARVGGSTSRWICDELYPAGLHDTHIDTALRRAVRELGMH